MVWAQNLIDFMKAPLLDEAISCRWRPGADLGPDILEKLDFQQMDLNMKMDSAGHLRPGISSRLMEALAMLSSYESPYG